MSMAGYYNLVGSITSQFYEVTDTNNATTTSGTDALLTTMTVTPVAGTYLCIFSTSIDNNAAGMAVSVSYYIGGTQKGASLVKSSVFDGGALSAGDARGVISLTTIATVNGSQAVEIRWSTSSGTATCGSRTLDLVRIN